MTLNRRERHGLILRLIREQAISTQAELAQALDAAGHDVVQTTVSRDIHELGLSGPQRRGQARLRPAGRDRHGPDRELGGTLRQLMLSCEPSGNLVLVHDAVGLRRRALRGDRPLPPPMILGTVAGENTILVVAREASPAPSSPTS